MSELDSKPTTVERRLAAYGRDALADAEANGRIDRLVETIVASASAAAVRAPESPPAEAPRPAPGTTWPIAIGSAALAGVVAFAAFGTREVPSEPAARPALASTIVAPASAVGSHELARPAPTSPGVAVTSLPDAVETKPVANARPSTAREPSHARSPEAQAPTPSAAPQIGDDAALLFERANTARRTEDHAAAEKLYRRLVDTHPATREAMTSRVILGRMQLARGAAVEALASFDAYLADAPHGTLEEQALIGRAQSLQALGRRSEERAAWRALLDAFPNTANRMTALERAADSP